MDDNKPVEERMPVLLKGEQEPKFKWSVIYFINGMFGRAPLATWMPLVSSEDLAGVCKQLSDTYNAQKGNQTHHISPANVVILNILPDPIYHSSLFVQQEESPVDIVQ